jgi:hypothetical protein
MPRIALVVLTIVAASSIAPVHAEFSEEWQAVADATEAECDAFSATLVSGDFDLTPDGSLKPPPHPRGVPSPPYACIFVRFDVNAGGTTENIEAAFKAPANLQYGYVREATNTVKKWRFKNPSDAPAGSKNNYTEVVYIAHPNWRYQYRIRLISGEPRRQAE